MKDRPITVAVSESASVTERFAADELAKYLQRIVRADVRTLGLEEVPTPDFAVGGEAVERLATTEDLSFIEKGTDEKETFIAVERNGTVILAGNRGRATLYSVYHLLEKLGARWALPGEIGVYLPTLESLDLTSLEERGEGSFAFRSLAMDISLLLQTSNEDIEKRFVDEILQEIDWAAKSKMNSLYISSQPRFEDYRDNPLESLWRRHKREIVEAIRKRDMILEYGGHVLPSLLPDALFESDKQLFRMKAGERTRTGNFCVSYPKTLETLKRNAAEFFGRHREADIFRVWPEDSLSGSWCSCPECSKLSAYEQSFRATTAVSEALSEASPRKYVDFLSYHDTAEPKSGISPQNNILLAYAPRERCYLHPINDPSCERNREYDRCLQANHQTFGGNIYIFEYYADTILYWSLFVPLSETISKDLEYLDKIGVNKASILLFGAHSFWLHGLNLYVFAKKSWNPALNTETLKKEFASALFPSAPHLFLELLDNTERAVPAALDFTCENIGEKNMQRRQRNIGEARARLAECEKLAIDMKTKAKSKEEQLFADAIRTAIQYTNKLLSSGLTQLFPLAIPILEGKAERLTDEQVKAATRLIQRVREGLQEGNRILRGVDKQFLGAWGEAGRPMTGVFMLRLAERLSKIAAEGKNLSDLELESLLK